MKQFEPVPIREVRDWARRLAGKSLEEILIMLGPPARELGASQRTAHPPDQPVEVIHHVRTLEFVEVSPSVKTLLVHVRDDGRFDFDLRGRELKDAE